MSEFNVEPEQYLEFRIPVVEIQTESFQGTAIELYEMPAGMILEMLAMPGPAQIKMMTKLFRMALVDPKQGDSLDGLSFNELSEILYQWYSQSPVRVGKKVIPTVSIEDIIGPPEGEDDEPF